MFRRRRKIVLRLPSFVFSFLLFPPPPLCFFSSHFQKKGLTFFFHRSVYINIALSRALNLFYCSSFCFSLFHFFNLFNFFLNLPLTCVCVHVCMKQMLLERRAHQYKALLCFFFLVGRREVRSHSQRKLYFRLPFIVPFFIFYFFLMRTLSMLQNPFLHSIEITTPRSLYFSFLRLA